MRSQLIALICALVLSGCASVPAPTSQPSLAAASDAYFQASRSADANKAGSLLAEDHLFVGPTGKTQDKTTRVAWLRDNRNWLPSVTTKNVQVAQFGQTGRVTGIWVIPDAGIIVQERFIHIWVIQDGRWQMISHHVTEIPKQGGGGS